jgi:L-ribulose-5-phosphate 4-epimerase
VKYAKERQAIIDCARKLERYGLVVFSGGNVSMRMADGNFLVTPSAMQYDSMLPEDIVLVDAAGKSIAGNRRPTSDLMAILYIFQNMPKINVILHSHQPKAVAVSLIADQLPVISTTMVDELCGEVPVAPFTISSDLGMGVSVVDYAKNALAVILKQHGAITFGNSLEQALSAAVYLEETCQIYLSVLASGRDVLVLTEDQIEAEARPRGYYGQPKAEG